MCLYATVLLFIVMSKIYAILGKAIIIPLVFTFFYSSENDWHWERERERGRERERDLGRDLFERRDMHTATWLIECKCHLQQASSAATLGCFSCHRCYACRPLLFLVNSHCEERLFCSDALQCNYCSLCHLCNWYTTVLDRLSSCALGTRLDTLLKSFDGKLKL